MNQPTAHPVNDPPDPRPVLFWQPDSDESHVQASVEQAAAFLGVPSSAVVAAIASGDLLNGWFVDWQAGQAA